MDIKLFKKLFDNLIKDIYVDINNYNLIEIELLLNQYLNSLLKNNYKILKLERVTFELNNKVEDFILCIIVINKNNKLKILNYKLNFK